MPELGTISARQRGFRANCPARRAVLRRTASGWLAWWPLRADRFIQYPACQIDVGQPQRDEGSRGVLAQATVAHLFETPQPFDDGKDMFNAGPHLGLDSVDQAFEVLGRTAFASFWLVQSAACGAFERINACCEE